ncbi:MAG: NHL repeat-containing protein [Daejeonella sp.]
MMKTRTNKFSVFCKTGTITKTLSLLAIAVILLPASCKKDKKTTPQASLMVSTLAGSGNFGTFLDGEGKQATFNSPYSVAVDQDGNVYVAAAGNNRIRKITKNGVVSTLAGGGNELVATCTGEQAQFKTPSGVAVDQYRNVYVADANNFRIRKITQPASGPVMVSTLAGTGISDFTDNTSGALAQFKTPFGVAVDAMGNVYVADYNSNRIRKITQPADGSVMVSTLAGSDTPGSKDKLQAGDPEAQFDSPRGVAVDIQGNVYVADSNNHRIRKISPAGIVTTLAGSVDPGTGEGGFTDGTGSAAKFNKPAGLTVDAQGNVYVGDLFNHRIRKITPAGEVSTLAGSGYLPKPDNPFMGAFLDGEAAKAQFYAPRGVAIDAQGKVYVADSGNHKIRKIE